MKKQMTASRLLRYARRHAGFSQRALAQRSGIKQPAIARIERGLVSPRLDTLDQLLSATGFTLELAPRPGEGVDRTLITAALERTSEEWILAAGGAGRNLAGFKAEVRDGTPR
jgi:transcriptional regulator with XRE-family HTH domain